MSPKQGPVSIGNASEATMDFQGSHMLVFGGSKQVNHSKLGNIPVGPTKDTSTSTYLLETGGIFKIAMSRLPKNNLTKSNSEPIKHKPIDESEYFMRFTVVFGRISIPKLPFVGRCLVIVISTVDEPTPPKTNMEPENEPLEEEIPMKNHHF